MMQRLLTVSALVGMLNISFPQIAQGQVFTVEETEIIQRQAQLLQASGIRGEGPAISFPPYVYALERGGSGLNRWALLNLGADRFGNRYVLDTRQVQALGRATSSNRGWLSGDFYEVWRTQFVVQLTFADQTGRQGVTRRHVTLEAECPNNSNLRYDFSMRRLRYDDYNSTGRLLNTEQFHERSQLIALDAGFEYLLALNGCAAAYYYPRLVSLLVQGQSNRTSVTTPSLFD